MGDGVNDRVTFITSLNHLEIQVQNLQLNINHETQAIAAVDWLLHNTGNPAPGQPSSVALIASGDAYLGTAIDITGPDTFAALAGGLAGLTNRWALYTSATQIAGGTELTTLSGGRPSQLIIGPPPYHVNSGVTNHTPYLETSAGTHISFLITYPDNSHVTDATVITQARLSFGTAFASGQELDLTTETPEPRTVALSLAGIALLCLGRLWRRRVKQVVRNPPPRS